MKTKLTPIWDTFKNRLMMTRRRTFDYADRTTAINHAKVGKHHMVRFADGHIEHAAKPERLSKKERRRRNREAREVAA